MDKEKIKPCKGAIKQGFAITSLLKLFAAGNGEGTYVSGINNSGRIVGWFDDGGKAHGFLMNFERTK